MDLWLNQNGEIVEIHMLSTMITLYIYAKTVRSDVTVKHYLMNHHEKGKTTRVTYERVSAN